MSFVFPELTEEIKMPLSVYGDNYVNSQIIVDFKRIYQDALDNNPAFAGMDESGLAPYLATETEMKNNPAYRGAPIEADSSGDDLFSESVIDVRDTFNIYVFFAEVKYTVTFDPNGATNADKMPEPKDYGYGISVVYPSEEPVNGDLLFVGWYFDTVDDNGDAIRRAWRFYDQPQGDGTTL